MYKPVHWFWQRQRAMAYRCIPNFSRKKLIGIILKRVRSNRLILFVLFRIILLWLIEMDHLRLEIKICRHLSARSFQQNAANKFPSGNLDRELCSVLSDPCTRTDLLHSCVLELNQCAVWVTEFSCSHVVNNITWSWARDSYRTAAWDWECSGILRIEIVYNKCVRWRTDETWRFISGRLSLAASALQAIVPSDTMRFIL